MWSSFKFYLSVLLMCIGCIMPAALLTLPEETAYSLGALVVFFAGGGLLYAVGALYFESYDGEWNGNHEIIMPIMTIIFSVIALILQSVILFKYTEKPSCGAVNLMMFDGDITEFYLRLFSMGFSGLALFPLFLMATGEIDTSEYIWERTTYYNGQEIKRDYVTKSATDSKVAFFFTTILVSCVGTMATSLPIILIVLALNVGQLIHGSKKRIPLILGSILAVVSTIYLVVEAYKLGDGGFGQSFNVALTILPLVFSVLTFIYFVGFFRVEWLSNTALLIVATFCMIFVSWIASYSLGDLIIKLLEILITINL